MRYFKFPKWLKRLYPNAIWDFSVLNHKETDPVIYLTFDDGPNPGTTEWLLALLDRYSAKATFFCIGKNVEQHPRLFARLSKSGHQIGNHSYGHPNGLYAKTEAYIADVQKAAACMDTKLFRPPYGKLKAKQHKKLRELGFTTIFWSHITYDFDPSLSSEKRVETALKSVENGDIVVFHDSNKAFPQLKEELPFLLEEWHKQGFQFKAIKLP